MEDQASVGRDALAAHLGARVCTSQRAFSCHGWFAGGFHFRFLTAIGTCGRSLLAALSRTCGLAGATISCQRSERPRFSGLVAIQPGHTLETHGIYEHIRNPSYLGMILMMLGWALAFRGGAGVLLMALLLPPLIARIRAEERVLRAHFGAEYDNYCAHTWRLVPGVY